MYSMITHSLAAGLVSALFAATLLTTIPAHAGHPYSVADRIAMMKRLQQEQTPMAEAGASADKVIVKRSHWYPSHRYRITH